MGREHIQKKFLLSQLQNESLSIEERQRLQDELDKTKKILKKKFNRYKANRKAREVLGRTISSGYNYFNHFESLIIIIYKHKMNKLFFARKQFAGPEFSDSEFDEEKQLSFR